MKQARTAALVALVGAVALAATGCERLRDRGDDGGPTPAAPPSSTALPSAAAPWEPTAEPCVGAGGHRDGCDVPGFGDRPFDIYVPSSYSTTAAMPVVLFLHGGGGNAEQTQAGTCPNGDVTDPGCLHGVGEAQGFLTVYANGTPSRLLPDVRTWNAGGGGPDYACASGHACDINSDDISYLRAVLDQVEREYNVDASRVYVMGFSNGAAMVHRVACEMADTVAAVVAVSGSNEYATNADCAPSRPIAVLQVHGTADPCWTYVTSNQACLDQDPRPKLGAAESVAGWVARDGCDPTATIISMPNTDPGDGTTTDVSVWGGCRGGTEVRLMTVNGGGHVFPSGTAQRPEGDANGPAEHDWGVGVLWQFVSRFSLD